MKHPPDRRGMLLTMVALACSGSACSREGTIDLLDLTPAGGEPLRERGAFELALQQCEQNVLRLLGAGSGKHPDLRRYRLPAQTDWPAVTTFYASKLDAAWRRSEVPEQQLGYRLRAWQREQAIGAQRFVVALLDQTGVGSDDARPFRMLVVAAEPR